MLPLRRTTPGPTLASRLLELVDDGRLFMSTAALLRTEFDARRTRLIFTASPVDVVPGDLTVAWYSEDVLVLCDS
jgi:hypothetical protein